MKKDVKAITNTLFRFDLTHSDGGTVCGCDEAGRGPLAGPVVCAAVILPYDNQIDGINDSKKVSDSARNRLYDQIVQAAIAYKIVAIDNRIIDEINILEATKRGMEQAILGLGVRPSVVLVDAVKGLQLNRTYTPIIQGDATSYAIAAASILAKVTRDRIMLEADKVYPQYGFSSNKGYGTRAHIEAFYQFGKTPLHRESFLKKLSKGDGNV